MREESPIILLGGVKRKEQLTAQQRSHAGTPAKPRQRDTAYENNLLLLLFFLIFKLKGHLFNFGGEGS